MPDQSGAKRKKRKILIADDSDHARIQFRGCLPEEEYDLIEAGDGEEALRLIRANPDLDLIFSDVNMPVLDGLEMALRLSEAVQRNELPSIPVVMLTTENSRDMHVQAKAAGVVGWLVKPAREEHIMKTVRKILKLAS